jgi:hypothetical protein
MKSLPRPLAFCVGIALLSALAFAFDAQAQNTTAALRGAVVDQDGEPLPGASVLAVHQPTGTRYGTSTDEDGSYNLQSLRVGGPYRMTVSFVGYQEATEEGFDLTLGQTRTIDFRLAQQAQTLEEVQVVSQRSTVINANRTGASTNISEEDIEQLPTIERSLSDFARLSPLSTGRGGNSLAGRNARYNNIQIDGATLNDVFGLSTSGTPGGQAGTQPISLDAIKEFNVSIAPYDVRNSGFTGGQINAVTKSGTNEFEGSLRYRRGGDAFIGDFNGRAYQGEFDENLFVGNAGGPIVEDELFFFTNVEVVREAIPVLAGLGEGRANALDFSRSQLTEFGGPDIDDETALVQGISTVADSTYGYDAGGLGALSEREDNVKVFAKLDWNISDDHRLTVRNNYVNAYQDNGPGRGAESYDFRNTQYQFTSVQNSLTAQLNSTLSSDLSNEARFVYTRIRDQRDPVSSPFPSVDINPASGTGGVGLGIGTFEQANALDQDLFEFTDNLTWTLGDHQLTFGTNNQLFAFSNLFIPNYRGSYTFEPIEGEDGELLATALEAFQRGQPAQYEFQYAIGPNGEPTGETPRSEFSGLLFGLYAQDEWQATDRLNLTLGLRADLPYLPENPSFNPTAFEAYGRSTASVPSGIDQLLFSPRFGFNLDATGLASDFSTQVRGGAGVFSGRPPFVWISNQYANTGVDFASLRFNGTPSEVYTDEDGNYDPDQRLFPAENPGDPASQPLPGESPALSPVQTTNVSLVSEDFTYPQTLRLDLAVDQELPGGLVATFEGLYSNTLRGIAYRNIELQRGGVGDYDGTTTAYGRPLYGDRETERFTDAILLENTSKGREWLASIQLQRERSGAEGVGGSISYTYNDAENVSNGNAFIAFSNWNDYAFDVNDQALGTSDYQVQHRFLGYGSYRFTYGTGGRFGTTVGLVYEGNSGSPYSWIYGNDANGDGVNFNDLAYVPESEGEIFVAPSGPNDTRTPDQRWTQLDAYIEGTEGLGELRGERPERNPSNWPWVNILDLQLTQDIATFGRQRIRINANLENLFAFADETLGIENDLGTLETRQFSTISLFGFDRYISEEDVGTTVAGRVVTEDDLGKPVVTFDEDLVTERLDGSEFTPSEFTSRWRLRLGVQYTF